jgi:hypothetical protein
MRKQRKILLTRHGHTYNRGYRPRNSQPRGCDVAIERECSSTTLGRNVKDDAWTGMLLGIAINL